jgi:hypothetical protein
MQHRSGAFSGAKALATSILLAASLLVAAGPGRTQTTPDLVDANAPEVKAIAGPWDLVEDVPHQRRCRIQLNGARPDRNVLVVGIQTPCRMSIPELSQARRWGLDRQGHIRLYRDNGKEIVAFNDAFHCCGGRKPDCPRDRWRTPGCAKARPASRSGCHFSFVAVGSSCG